MRSILLLLSLFIATSSFAETKSFALIYNGGMKNFSHLRLEIFPAGRALYFKSFKGKSYVLDCLQDQKDLNHWNCSNPCGSGTVKLEFEGKEGFSNFVIKKLAVRPRLCDGSEGEYDKWVSSAKPLKFTFKQATARKDKASKKKAPSKKQ